MASSWGNSWGASWGNSWGAAGATIPSTAGQTILTKGAGSGRAFTRKHYDEFMAAERALKALEAKAKEVTGKRRVVIQAAAKASAEALHAVEEEAAEGERVREIVALTNAMNAAASAKALAATIKMARAAENYAQQMMDDEEDALFILLQ